MNERCWRELESQLCPTNKWVDDKQKDKCHCCLKEFKLFVRRKHHCRFCGNIFCSSCSNYFLNGTYIGPKVEKYLRHCEFCHQKIEKFIRDTYRLPEMGSSAATEFNGSDSDDSHEEDEIIHDLQKNPSQESTSVIDKEIHKYVATLSSELCLKTEHFDSSVWKDKLADICLTAAMETRMETLAHDLGDQEYMDIVNYVPIRTLITKFNMISANVFKGIVLEKTLSHKKMASTFTKPRILLVEKSIDINSLGAVLNFEEMMKNEDAIMQKILSKIQKLNPDIIFVEESVDSKALQFFADNKISVVCKLQSNLQIVRQIAGIKRAVSQLWFIDKAKPSTIIGKCDKIYLKQVSENQTLMFIEADRGIRTLIIGDESINSVAAISDCAKTLLRFSRQLILEKEIVLRDLFYKNELRKYRHTLIQAIDPNPYLSLNAYRHNQNLFYTKIVFSQIKHHQAERAYLEYGTRLGVSSFYRVCGQVNYEKVRLYTNEDLTLGSYILFTVASSEKGCRDCNFTHSQCFYRNGYILKIELTKMQTDTSKSMIDDTAISDTELNINALKRFFKKLKTNMEIESNFRCEICQEILTQNVRPSRLYYQISFHHFIDLLTSCPGYRKESDEMMSLPRHKFSISECDHGEMARVFIHSNTLLKVTTHLYQTYILNYIYLESEKSIKIIQESEIKFIEEYFSKELKNKVDNIDTVFTFLGSLALQKQLISLPEIPQKVALFYEYCQQIRDIISRLMENLKELEVEIKQNTSLDWTTLGREFHKIANAVSLILIILLRIDEYAKHKNTQPTINNGLNTISEEIPIPHSNSEYLRDTLLGLNFLSQETSEYQQLLVSTKHFRYYNFKGRYLDIPIASKDDPVSVLGCGLNSQEFLKALIEEPHAEAIRIRLAFDQMVNTSSPIKTELLEIYSQVFQSNYENKSEIYGITAFYHHEFSRLRQQNGIDEELYVRSLCGCQMWDSSGGKSQSKFAKSQNQLLVVKIIVEKEFDEFQKFAPEYLKYLNSEKRISVMARIYGMYEVIIRNKIHKCIVMQNIFFGLNDENNIVYDLKGSEVNRLNFPQGDKPVTSITGQDTNFRINRNGEPYVLDKKSYEYLMIALEADAQFLKEQHVIDYSLLVIESSISLRVGIIDFLRPYHITERLENAYKQLKTGRDPTVIPPKDYSERFLTAMKQYFIKVES